MKKFLFALALLLAPSLTQANDMATLMGKDIDAISTISGKAKTAISTFMGGGVPSAPAGTVCAADGLLLGWDMASVTIDNGSGGAIPCSMGDKSANASGAEVDLTSNAGKMTLLDTSDNGGDNMQFSPSSYDIFPAGNGTLRVKINLSVISNNTALFQVYLDTNNNFVVLFNTASGNDITVSHKGDNTYVSKTFDVNLSTNTDYDIIIKWSTSDGMAISVNGGSSYTTDGTKDITQMTHAGTGTNIFKVGNISAVNGEGTLDDFQIWYGWRNDF